MSWSLPLLMAALAAASPDPRSTELLGRAHAAMVYKDYESALPLWRELSVLEPRNASVRVELGRCLLRLGQPHAAVAALEEAVALEPAVKEGESLLNEARRHAAAAPEPQASAAPAAKPVGHVGGSSEPSLGELSRRMGKHTGTGKTYELGPASGAGSDPGISPEEAEAEARAPRTLLDSMRQRAEGILRPRMLSAAPAIQELLPLWQQYEDACYGKTTTTYTRADGSTGTVVQGGAGFSGQEPSSYGSESQWGQYWTSATTHRNEDTPECRGLASRINSLATTIQGAMAGADRELAMPPSVYPGVREEVFDRLANELW